VPTSDTPGIPTWFIALFVVMAGFLLIGIVGAIWRAAILRRGGLNPMFAREQLEIQLAQHLRDTAAPTSGQPAKTAEERLAELENLRERGVITAEELAVGRAKIIGGDWA
jgi:hypothetical protein